MMVNEMANRGSKFCYPVGSCLTEPQTTIERVCKAVQVLQSNQVEYMSGENPAWKCGAPKSERIW